MKKSFLCLFGFLMIVFLSHPGNVIPQTTAPIVIGAPIPRAYTYGENGERSLILAADEINAAGGIKIGPHRHPIKLEIVDTRDQEPGVPTSEVLLSLEKLILDKKVSILVGGPCMSETCLAALDLPPKYKVTHVTSIGCWTPGWHAKTGKDIANYKYSFRLSGHVGYWVSDLAELLRSIKEKHGFNKMYITVAEAAHTKAAAAAVEKLAVPDGWTIVGREVHPLATTDYSMMLREVRASGAQVLFIWDHTPESLAMIKQWYDLKIPAVPIGFVGMTEDPAMWKETRGKVAYLVGFGGEGGTLPGQAITPLTKPFFEAFKKRWGVEPRGTGNVPSYTVLYMLKDAIERAGTLDVESLISAIEKTDLITIGGRLRFDKVNHQAIYGTNPKEALVSQTMQWQDGKRISIWPSAITVGEFKLPPWVKTAK